MDTLIEMISLKLHKVEHHKTPYVVTLYYPSLPPPFQLKGEDIFNIVHSLVRSNEITFDDVTIFYYHSDNNRVEEIHECFFESFQSSYTSHHLIKRSLSEMSDEIYEIHRTMLRAISGDYVFTTIDNAIL